MNILFLSRWFPFPINNGSKLRIHHLLTNLSKTNNISLISFIDQSQSIIDPSIQYPNISRIEVVPWKPYNAGSASAISGLFRPIPRFIIDTYSHQMDKLIKEYISIYNFDLIIASQLSMASYYRCFNNIPAIFEELELGFFHNQVAHSRDQIKRFRYMLTWKKLRAYLSRLLFSFKVCTVVSQQERLLFLDTFPEHEKKVEVVPNCINLKDYENLHERHKANQIIFTGSFNFHPNYEAMIWFVSYVFPIILEHLPDVQLIITGDHANLPLPSDKNITLTGYIEDITTLIASTRVAIVPILNGGGTRLKILEAMAIGTPVVSTSKGAEGLDIKSGEHLLIADTPEAFSEHVIRLMRDGDLRDRLANNAKHLVKEKYDWEIVIPLFQQILASTTRNTN